MTTSPMNVTLSGNALQFERAGERFLVQLHRTLRLPEDGKAHGLPPSLGSFPLKQIADYRDRVPAAWREHGGVFFPMWQREAMWLQFTPLGRPHAVKVAAGKVNAVSGEDWSEGLQAPRASLQDYLVCPPQPWLDGFNTGSGKIRQFVAMPLGLGYTVEGQVTGREDVGGLQILVVPPKDGLLPPRRSYFAGSSSPDVGGGSVGGYASAGPYTKSLGGAFPAGAVGSSMPRGMRSGGPLRGGNSGPWLGGRLEPTAIGASYSADVNSSYEMAEASVNKGAEMGLAQGGEMVQKIYPDEHGIEVWMPEAAGRMFVHIVNSELYRQITGEAPPPSPITAKDYTAKGYPWFEIWDGEMGDVPASGKLAGVKTVGQKDQAHGFSGQQDDSPVHEKTVPAGVVKPGGIAQGKEWG